ncbi:glycine reductase, partial [Photobacterium sp. OFAV2-7]|nr:glycine reductase [Photobacterium sp. OFAV2-7]
AGAMRLCADAAKGSVMKRVDEEWEAASLAGLNSVLTKYRQPKQPVEAKAEVTAPPEKVTDAEIGGIDILEIEDACQALWKASIFARTGMGCTGPIVLVARDDLEQARAQLTETKFIG